MNKRKKNPKNISPLLSILMLVLFLAPIFLVALLVSDIFSHDSPIFSAQWIQTIRSFKDANHLSASIYISGVAAIAFFWGLATLIYSSTIQNKKDRDNGFFIGMCLIGSAVVALLSTLVLAVVEILSYKLFGSLSGVISFIFFIIILISLRYSGPYFTKLLFIRSEKGRYVIDHSAFYGGLNMKREKKK